MVLMNRRPHPLTRLAATALLLASTLGALCLLAGCKTPERSGVAADGQVVEHKVFYEGWGWSKGS